ncbi:MAG: VWA domain-containing protein [Gordonia amarae]
MAGPLGKIAGMAADQSCFDFHIAKAANTDVPAMLSGGASKTDLWAADSQTHARRVTAQVRRNTDYVSESIATSPTVVVGSTLRQAKTWVDVMQISNLQVGSPMETSTGDSIIIGGATTVASGGAKQSDFDSGVMAMTKQRQNVAKGKDTDEARLALAGSAGVPAVASEQQYLAFLHEGGNSRLTAMIPESGTVMLNYPLVNVASDSRKDLVAKAGGELTRAAQSAAGRQVLNTAGFRNPDGSGVGEKVTVMKLADPKVIDEALIRWQLGSVPTRLLNVVDTSGSMGTPAGMSTRAQLLSDAAVVAAQMDGNSTQIGVWIFGIDKGGKGQDWKEVVPIRRLDDTTDGVVQRRRVMNSIRKAMKDELGGGTGLYDSTLAAYQKMVSSYDPADSNLVVVVTDGKNEDANSISFEELLSQLKALYDPARPVHIVTIGISEDADAASLKQISDATGGASYIARTPEDIKVAFSAERQRLMQG